MPVVAAPVIAPAAEAPAPAPAVAKPARSFVPFVVRSDDPASGDEFMCEACQ
jgi:hypothetical protein